MDGAELEAWYDAYRALIEEHYLNAEEPWHGSGFSGPRERWELLRRPIAEAVDRSGSFLDIGCANGYLLESLVGWTAERGIELDPHGIDISPSLARLAAERLPRHAAQMQAGNGLDWIPPRRYDYVRTELCYVPLEHHPRYVRRLVDQFLNDGGALLVAHYRGRNTVEIPMPVEEWLRELGFATESIHTADDYRDGVEKTRVAVVRKG